MPTMLFQLAGPASSKGRPRCTPAPHESALIASLHLSPPHHWATFPPISLFLSTHCVFFLYLYVCHSVSFFFVFLTAFLSLSYYLSYVSISLSFFFTFTLLLLFPNSPLSSSLCLSLSLYSFTLVFTIQLSPASLFSDSLRRRQAMVTLLH